MGKLAGFRYRESAVISRSRRVRTAYPPSSTPRKRYVMRTLPGYRATCWLFVQKLNKFINGQTCMTNQSAERPNG